MSYDLRSELAKLSKYLDETPPEELARQEREAEAAYIAALGPEGAEAHMAEMQRIRDTLNLPTCGCDGTEVET